jgi:sigma-B regulation protein RsbU (phosphoserine phosphatase)
MVFFLIGLASGMLAIFILYYRAQRELERIGEEKQVVTQEIQIVVDFMRHMAEALAENPRREELYQRIVHASILCTGAMSACIFERTSENLMRGAALEGLFSLPAQNSSSRCSSTKRFRWARASSAAWLQRARPN